MKRRKDEKMRKNTTKRKMSTKTENENENENETVSMSFSLLFLLFCLFAFYPLAFCQSKKSPSVDQQFLSVDYNAWQTVLDQFVKSGGSIDGISDESAVDYAALRSYGSSEFSSFLSQLSSTEYPTESVNQQFALLINAYNAFAVNMVVQHPCKAHLGKFCWPISSIRDISGYFQQVWDMDAGVLASTVVSLNDIESKVRGLSDPRIHACIVCASASCPNLQPIAFFPNSMEEMKNLSMMQFLSNQEKGLKLVPGSNLMYLSPIFLWYQSDFETFAFPTLNGGKVRLFFL